MLTIKPQSGVLRPFTGKFQNFINSLLSVCLVLTILLGSLLPNAKPAAAQSSTLRADALIIINTNSGGIIHYTQWIKPYLDYYGIPCTVWDLATNPTVPDFASYAVIIIGHDQLDYFSTYLTAAIQSQITQAVSQGTGLVNFDTYLATSNYQDFYSYVRDLFGFSYYGTNTETIIRMATGSALGDYITALQTPGTTVTLRNPIPHVGIVPRDGSATLASIGMDPMLVTDTYGSGRVVQWAAINWIAPANLGPVSGLDDLVWRSIVWAARKPFVLQGLPPLVTFRVDDVVGPYTWATSAIQAGFKPWVGIFLDQVTDVPTLKSLADSGNLTVSIHARTYDNSFYFNHQTGSNLSDAVLNQNYTDGTNWHLQNQIPISKVVVPHYYEIGSNAFAGLANWGVEYVVTPMQPGSPYGSDRLLAGPFFLYTNPCTSGCSLPIYYTDQLSIPGHPEFNGRFSVVMSEIRDIGSYEWFPSDDPGYLQDTIDRGVAQIKRALSGMELSTLFTHEDYIHNITDDNWRTILAGVTSGISSYQPQFVTLDYAAQYVRAMTTSSITSSIYDPANQRLDTNLVGSTDLVTQFHLFTENNGTIQTTRVDVPVFSGSTLVSYPLSSPPLPTATPSPTLLPSPTLSPSPVPSATQTPTRTPTLNATSTRTSTATVTATQVPTQTSTFTATALPSQTPSPTLAQSPSQTPTRTNTPAQSPTFTPTATATQPLSEVLINCWEDAHQDPVLVTTTNPADLVTTDNLWTEFYWSGRAYPGIFAAYTETPPLFHCFGTVPNGTYSLAANLYWSHNLRYYWGTTSANPEAFSYDVTSGNSGNFAEYTLGTVTVTNGSFDLYTRRADALTGGVNYPFFGWSWIRLVPQAAPTTTPLPTATASLTPAPTLTRTFTPTSSPPPTATQTPTVPPAASPTPTASFTFTATLPATSTATFPPSATSTALITSTATPTFTQTPTITRTPTRTPTASRTPAPSRTPTRTRTFTPTRTPTRTLTPTRTYTPTATWTVLPSATATLTPFPTATNLPSLTATYTATPSQTLPPTATGTFTNTAVASPTATFTRTATATATSQPSNTPTHTATATLVSTQTLTPTVTATQPLSEVLINCWEDAHQDPVLVTTTNPADLVTTDNLWTEFYWSGRAYPGIFAAYTETPPLFHCFGTVPNGTYSLAANLYWSHNLRYYWGTTSANPEAFSYDVTSGNSGNFAEYTLGTVTVTNGSFDLYTRRADALTGGVNYPFFGWSWIRLVP